MKRFDVAAVVCVAAVAAWLMALDTLAADPPPTAESEQWGPEVGGLRTRLVPLEKKFVLGQPMKLRLEMRNVGQRGATYYPPEMDGLEVLDPQGKPVCYIGWRGQTMIGKLPSLAPGSSVILSDRFDLASQYFVVKPGKYTVQYKRDWGGIPESNSLAIDVQTGSLPTAWHVALRLCEALPKGWQLTDAQAEPSKNAPPGWETGRRVSVIRAVCSDLNSGMGNYGSGRGVGVSFWISDRKLDWTGAVPCEGSMAAFYMGKCPEGHVYACLMTYVEAAAAKWPTFEKDIEKALRTVSDYSGTTAGGVQDDDDLEHLKELQQIQHLDLANTKITDAGLRHLKGLTQLKELRLTRTLVTDAGLQYIKGLTQLEWLWLEDTKITDAGLKNIEGFTRLQWLELSRTQTADAGLEHLKGLSQLQVLKLNGTKITDAGLQHLKGLTHSLGLLWLDGTQISDAGLIYLKGLTPLANLSLTNTKITDAGLKHLEGLTGLHWLYLEGTQITDAGLEHIKGLTGLRSLDLDKTHVTDQGVKKLQQALPRCEIIY